MSDNLEFILENVLFDNRRNFIKRSGALGVLAKIGFFGISPSARAVVSQWQESWFASNDLSETFKKMGVVSPTSNNNIILNTPDTAENGSYVGVSVKSAIDNTLAIAILVDKNPSVLAGYFEFGNSVIPEIATKIKMAETSNVYALVKSENKFFMNKKNVNVTVGGCGN